jgi:hypothetical protein
MLKEEETRNGIVTEENDTECLINKTSVLRKSLQGITPFWSSM